MKNIAKFHPLLSRCNDTVIVLTSIQHMLKASLFSTNEVADTCSTSVVKPYYLTAEKKFISTVNVS